MKGTLNIIALATEVLTTEVEGAGNFASYLNFENMVSGDVVTVNQYIDIEGEAAMKTVSSVSLSYDDLIDAGENGSIAIPFTIEALQTAVIGVTATAGTMPLDIGWRITDIRKGA